MLIQELVHWLETFYNPDEHVAVSLWTKHDVRMVLEEINSCNGSVTLTNEEMDDVIEELGERIMDVNDEIISMISELIMEKKGN